MGSPWWWRPACHRDHSRTTRRESQRAGARASGRSVRRAARPVVTAMSREPHVPEGVGTTPPISRRGACPSAHYLPKTLPPTWAPSTQRGSRGRPSATGRHTPGPWMAAFRASEAPPYPLTSNKECPSPASPPPFPPPALLTPPLLRNSDSSSPCTASLLPACWLPSRRRLGASTAVTATPRSPLRAFLGVAGATGSNGGGGGGGGGNKTRQGVGWR